MKKYLLMAMAVLAALSLMVAGCGGKEEAKKAEPAKVLRVGTEPTFAPFEFQKEGSKEYTGFDMDLIRAIGKQMGYKVEIMNMGFDALIPALSSGNIDTVIAGMSITPERQEAVLFSAPYYRSGLVVMVQKNNDTIKGIEDLVGKRIAVQIGTTGAAKAESVKDAKVTAFNTNTEAAMELKNGGVDAVINDSPVVGYYLAQGGSADAKTVGDVLEAEEYGIAVKKGNDKLAAEIDKALAELKKNGEYDKIYKTWFGEVKKYYGHIWMRSTSTVTVVCSVFSLVNFKELTMKGRQTAWILISA